MKRLFNIVAILTFIGLSSSCVMFVRDSYEYPNSRCSGAIVDSLTGEPIQMDVQESAYVQYYQQNYGPVEEAQNFTLRSDGTWDYTQVYEGDYYFVLQNKNYISDVDTIKNCKFEKGKNNHFEIKGTPLHKIYDWDIRIDDETNELVAGTHFMTEIAAKEGNPDVFAYWTDNIALFIDPAPYVGNFYFRYSQKMPVSWPCIVDTYREFRIPLDDPELRKEIKRGEKYYVRLGVQTFGSEANGAKFQGLRPYNFTEPVRLQF